MGIETCVNFKNTWLWYIFKTDIVSNAIVVTYIILGIFSNVMKCNLFTDLDVVGERLELGAIKTCSKEKLSAVQKQDWNINLLHKGKCILVRS